MASSFVVSIICHLPPIEIGLNDLPKLGGGAPLAPTELALEETVNFTFDSSAQFKTFLQKNWLLQYLITLVINCTINMTDIQK